MTPTVAISGSVKMLDATVPRSSGCTASPSACHIATRPCMAATDASISTPVQSPAAYTPRADVRETRSTVTNPPGPSATPASARPMPVGVGHRADRDEAVRALDDRAVGERDLDPVRRVRAAEAALDRDSTCMPRRRKTSSITCAASGSSPGSTCSREETSTTWDPSAW